MQGVDEAEYALRTAEALGAEYAEAYFERSYANSFAIEQGRVNASAHGEEAGIRIRLIMKGRLYTASTNKLDKGCIKRLIHRFRIFPGLTTRLSREKRERASYKVHEKQSVDDANMLKDLMKIDKELGKAKHIRYRSLYGGLGRSRTYYVNSDGTRISSDVPSTSAFFAITVSNGRESRQSMTQLGNTGGYEYFDASEVSSDLVDSSKRLHSVLERGKTLSNTALKSIKNIVISPEISGIASHESVGHPNEADRVFGREAAQAGTSYMTRENMGLEIGSKAVTIIDDPTIRNSNGYYLYDEEGVRARPREIVEKGVQKEMLTNREFAHLLGLRSNGSARSDSYSNEPLIRMSNTYLKPGSATLDELISEAGNGIYLKRFSSTEWNIDDTRSFARYAGNEAYIIRKGSLEEPVKNYKLDSATLDFWHAVALIGNDFELYVATCGKGEPMQGVPVTNGGASALLRFK
ncbi:MAG: TldD/PmbA family protein [Candidatus Micrarchaeales archaeon]